MGAKGPVVGHAQEYADRLEDNVAAKYVLYLLGKTDLEGPRCGKGVEGNDCIGKGGRKAEDNGAQGMTRKRSWTWLHGMRVEERRMLKPRHSSLDSTFLFLLFCSGRPA